MKMTNSPKPNKLNRNEKVYFQELLEAMEKLGYIYEFKCYPNIGATYLYVKKHPNSNVAKVSSALCNMSKDIYSKKRGKLITLQRFFNFDYNFMREPAD
jgi:hypothetical protein